MHISVSLHGFGEWAETTVELDEGATYLDLLEALDIPAETVVVFADERPVPEDAPVGDLPVRLVRVVSGGRALSRGERRPRTR